MYHPRDILEIRALDRACLTFGSITHLFVIEEGSDPRTWADPHGTYIRPPSLEAALQTYRQGLSCSFVGINTGRTATTLDDFEHPEHCVYLFGSQAGLPMPREVTDALDHVVEVESPESTPALSIAQAGAIVLHDRFLKRGWRR
jgi:hypothetical protein